MSAVLLRPYDVKTLQNSEKNEKTQDFAKSKTNSKTEKKNRIDIFLSRFGGDKQEVDFEKTGKKQTQMLQTEPISEASFWHCCKQAVQVGSAKWAVAKQPRGL